MKINLTIQVESPAALATILQMGSTYSFYDYKVTTYTIIKNNKKKSKGTNKDE